MTDNIQIVPKQAPQLTVLTAELRHFFFQDNSAIMLPSLIGASA
jgi:hypothetical protein